MQEFSGEEVLKGDDFKMYIGKLRGKSSTYKVKKAELNELRSEFGILSRTEEILKAQEAQVDEQLVRIIIINYRHIRYRYFIILVFILLALFL